MNKKEKNIDWDGVIMFAVFGLFLLDLAIMQNTGVYECAPNQALTNAKHYLKAIDGSLIEDGNVAVYACQNKGQVSAMFYALRSVGVYSKLQPELYTQPMQSYSNTNYPAFLFPLIMFGVAYGFLTNRFN